MESRARIFYHHSLGPCLPWAWDIQSSLRLRAQSAATMRDVQRYAVCRHRCSNSKKTISLHNSLIITKTQHSRYLPSVNIGEYRAGTERPEDGGLYPLEDPGTYGAVPRQKHPGKWSLPPAYVPRWDKHDHNDVRLSWLFAGRKNPKPMLATTSALAVPCIIKLSGRHVMHQIIAWAHVCHVSRKNNDWSVESDRGSIRRGYSPAPPRQERAVSEPPVQKKKGR